MLPFYKKYWRTAFDIGLIVLTVYLIMLAFSYFYRIATPIIFSLIIFMCIEPLAKRLNKIGIKKSIASAISILFFSLIILAAFTGAALIIKQQGTALIENFPRYQEMLLLQISEISSALNERFPNLPISTDISQNISDLIQSASASWEKISKTVLSHLVSYVSSVSSFIFNFAIGVVLAYFLSIEIADWRKLANEKTPRTFKTAFYFLKENVLKGIGSYIKAQAKLISITFIVIFIALLLLGVNNAFVIAVVAAIFDVLPLLGVSTVFIPWIIYLFIVGEVTLAIWLTALLVVVLLTRQMLEPKITGDSLGVSAFTMLAFMIISMSLFGIAGVILSPILIILLKSLYDQGYFHRWIHAPLGEFDETDKPQDDDKTDDPPASVDSAMPPSPPITEK